MSDPNDLFYDYAGISTVAAAINSFVSQMNANLAEVDGEFKKLLANGWQGKGADAFQGKSAQWHAAAKEMETTLAQFSTKVGDAGVRMQQVDSRVAGMFG